MTAADSARTQQFLTAAIELAVRSVETGGGPFGAVVVRDDAIVGTGMNRVTVIQDPSAHAEVMAIRDACRTLGTFTLADCELYSSCEPCPMCAATSFWARLPQVRYAADRNDAAAAGFDDAALYQMLHTAVGSLPTTGPLAVQHLPHADASKPFDAWRAYQQRIAY